MCLSDSPFKGLFFTDSESGNVGLAVAIPVLLLVLIVVMVMIIRRRRACGFTKRAPDPGSDMHSLPDSIIETRYAMYLLVEC